MPTAHFNLAISPEEQIQNGEVPTGVEETPVVAVPGAVSIEEEIQRGAVVVDPSVVPVAASVALAPTHRSSQWPMK